MSMDNLRILVIGAGVNGSAVAAGLHNGGLDVTVLARGERYQALLNEGIIIENPFRKNKRNVTRVPVIDCLEPQDRYDFVLVVIRKNQVPGVLPALAQNCSPNIVFMGNNLCGPQEFIQVLGRERVMMGAVYAAGKRDGNLVRAMVFTSAAAPFGELDGSLSPRLKQLTGILRRAGFKAEESRDIVNTQRTHAAGVALIARLVINHACNTYALGRSPKELRLYTLARREALQVLEALGYQVLPKSEAVMAKLPVFLQVAGMQALLGTRFGEVGLGWHCSQAPDEVGQLANELEALVAESGLDTPAIRELLGTAGKDLTTQVTKGHEGKDLSVIKEK
jgi:2-dehydropantoate 2-reductase